MEEQQRSQRMPDGAQVDADEYHRHDKRHHAQTQRHARDGREAGNPQQVDQRRKEVQAARQTGEPDVDDHPQAPGTEFVAPAMPSPFAKRSYMKYAPATSSTATITAHTMVARRENGAGSQRCASFQMP